MALGILMYSIKRLYGFPLELRSYREEHRARLLEAEELCDRIERLLAARELEGSIEVEKSEEAPPGIHRIDDDLRGLQSIRPRDWTMTEGAITEDID